MIRCARQASTNSGGTHDGHATGTPDLGGIRSMWVIGELSPRVQKSWDNAGLEVTHCTLTPVWPNLKRVRREGATRRVMTGGG